MLSLIVPVYKNEESLPDLLAALQDMNGQLAGSLEVVLVVDGSPDRSYAILQERLPATGLRATLVLLTRICRRAHGAGAGGGRLLRRDGG